MEDQENKQIEVALDKNLVFKEYSSLELSTRDKFINKIKSLGFDKEDIQWVASQKIHGSNFSIHCNGETARYGRRTDFLTKEIPIPCEEPKEYFNQTFYDAKTLVKKFHNNLNLIFNKIKEIFPNVLRYSIYGEYFGGYWPQTDPNYIKGGPKHIQLGVFYTPNHEFYAFDIFIVCDDKSFWADVDMIPKLLGNYIPSVPIYAKGTFETVFNTKSDIDSTIPAVLGLTNLEKNICEGLVIRPNKNLKTPSEERVIIKKKNKQFLEVTSKPNPAKQKKKQKGIDPQIAPFIEELLKYLNVNRINSVVSKFPDLKDRSKLKDLVSKDIITDAQKDQFKFPLTEEKHKKVLQELNLQIIKQINNYFIAH